VLGSADSASGSALLAHIDEGGAPLPDGNRMYGITAVISEGEEQASLCQALRDALLPGQRYLHHRHEKPRRRLEIARAVAELPFSGALVVVRSTAANEQERARTCLLSWLLPHLRHVEHVREVVIESRHGSDIHDRRTARRLVRSRKITEDLRIRHVSKLGDERLWLADFIMGAYGDATLHGRPEAWEIISKSHCIEVRTEPR
jgi:hypothetical protein